MSAPGISEGMFLFVDVGLKQRVVSEDDGQILENLVCVCVCVHVYMWVYLCMFESALHCVGVLAVKTMCATVSVKCYCLCIFYDNSS